MTIIKACACIVMLLIIPKHGSAEMLSDEYVKCMSDASGNYYDMVECINNETNKSDKLLNTIYQELMSALSESKRYKLKKAQISWIAYRDANCDFYMSPDASQEARLLRAECVMTETETRVHELSTIFAKEMINR